MKPRAVFLSAVFSLLIWQSALATTWHVPSQCPTIQAGIDSASYGDTVLVAAGTYEEHDLLLPSGVTLISVEGPEVTIIDAQGFGRVITVEEGASNTTRIEGFTITGGHSNAGAGVYCYHADAKIVGNILTGNTATSYGGAIALDECCATVEGNTICSNWANYGGGVAVWGVGYSPLIRENEITDNEADEWGGGIDSWECSPVIESNSIARNMAGFFGGGISCSGGTTLIRENTIVSNAAESHGGPGGGIYCWANESATIEGNLIIHNFPGLDGIGGGLACLADEAWIIGNTFSLNHNAIWINTDPPNELVLDRNNISFNSGRALSCQSSSHTITCCNFYNVWNFDDCGEVIGVDGNFSENPLFCDRENYDFTLDACSPCLPGNHPQGWDCGLIGALGEGCSTASVVEQTESWSTIKALFR